MNQLWNHGRFNPSYVVVGQKLKVIALTVL